MRLLVSAKTRVYTLISVSFCSNTKNSTCACFMKIRIQYNPWDNSCCISRMRLNMWFYFESKTWSTRHFVGFLWVLSFLMKITHFRTVSSRVRSSQFRWWDSKTTFKFTQQCRKHHRGILLVNVGASVQLYIVCYLKFGSFGVYFHCSTFVTNDEQFWGNPRQ